MSTEDNGIQVQNLADHLVFIVDDDYHRVYNFAPGETKSFKKDEVLRLGSIPGADVLFKGSLSIKDRGVRREFGISDDAVEYDWQQKDVDNVLLNGSLDRLLDALDFAPDAIVEMIVDRAVALKISDLDKREAIQKATGRDITKQIDFVAKEKEMTGSTSTSPKKKSRRVSSSETTTASKSRTRRASSSTEQKEE